MLSQQDISLQRIEMEIRRRSLTDRRMGYVWIIVPVLPMLAAIVFAGAIVGIVISSISNLQQTSNVVPAVAQIVAVYTVALIAIYVVLIADSLAFYFLLDRRNRHFKRQQLLFAEIPTYLLAMKGQASNNCARLIELADSFIFEEKDRPASLWAILSLFAMPIVGLVIAYNLTQDMRKHEELQSAYQLTLPLALQEVGIAQPPVSALKPRNRDPIVFLVLTAITAGVFWVYWFYTLLKDYNDHFAAQAVFEDQVLAILRPMVICQTCKGSIPQNAKFCPLCGTAQLSG